MARALAVALAGCCVALGGALGLPSAAGAAAIWRLEQPPPPPGSQFKVPLGPPGDLKCFAANRCLLAVEGNAAIPRGLFSYDGLQWHQLSTVCGGPADTTRIAFAGPREFWVVTEPSRPRLGSGLALCHFRDGQVVASYSTPDQSPDPFRQMLSAACNGPGDCWFGGVGSQDPIGERVGAFHLHWDGSRLETVYDNGRGRAVSDMEPFQGAFWETTLVGPAPESRDDPVVTPPESPKPRLIHHVQGTAFTNDPFVPADKPGVPPDGTELLTVDGDGQQLWAAGGGAASGSAAPDNGSVARPPIVARLLAGSWTELPIDGSLFGSNDRVADVAAVPGTTTAWAAVQPFADRRSLNSKAKVALVQADGSASVTRLPVSGGGRGSAARIEFTGPSDGWLVTWAGWLFHFTDGSRPARDTDPAFQGTISFRPNESVEQFVPDAPPADDSQLFAPPPVEPEQETKVRTRTRRIAPLLRKVSSKLRGRVLTVSFVLSRKAHVALIGRRRGRIVARTRGKLFKPGRRKLRLRLDRRRWPTRLSFSTREPGKKGSGDDGGGGDNTITTSLPRGGHP